LKYNKNENISINKKQQNKNELKSMRLEHKRRLNKFLFYTLLFEKQSRAIAAGDIILIFPIIRVGHGFSRIYFQTAALLPYIGI